MRNACQRWCLLLFIFSAGLLPLTATAQEVVFSSLETALQSSGQINAPGAFNQEAADRAWKRLSLHHFGERPIIEGDGQNVVRIKAPFRTENDAFVPVSVETSMDSSPERFIEKLYLIVDINPIPLAGLFTMTPNRPLEQISTRVRVNGYTYVRAIAETSDGTLYMDKQLVKSRGAACAAPPITDPDDAIANLGKMRFKFSEGKESGKADVAQLMISHPNTTGMQKDQISLLYIPEHYVKEVEVKFNDELVMHAETSFTLSENPTFRFSFKPDEEGELTARVVDTKNDSFTLVEQIKRKEKL